MLCLVRGSWLLLVAVAGLLRRGWGGWRGTGGWAPSPTNFEFLVIFLSFLLNCSTTYKVSCGKFIILESVLLYLWQINHVLTELLHCVLYYFSDYTKKSVFFSLGY